MAKRKPKQFDQVKGAKAIARERVGTVPSTRVIVEKKDRKPKHPKRDRPEQQSW